MTTRVSGADLHDLPARLHPVLLWHHDVHDDNVGRQLGGRLHRLHPVPGRAHHLELLGILQHRLKPFPHDRMVVGEQHPYAARLC